jgi:hypothetical protein
VLLLFFPLKALHPLDIEIEALIVAIILTTLHMYQAVETQIITIPNPTLIYSYNNYRPSMPMPRLTLGTLRMLLGCSVSYAAGNPSPLESEAPLGSD